MLIVVGIVFMTAPKKVPVSVHPALPPAQVFTLSLAAKDQVTAKQVETRGVACQTPSQTYCWTYCT